MNWLKKLFSTKSENPSSQSAKSIQDLADQSRETLTPPITLSPWKMPIEGSQFPLTLLPDIVFGKGLMGVGFAIEPRNKKQTHTLKSPINGKVFNIFPGGHAISLMDENGVELLIHIGLDSAKLKGEGLNLHIAENDLLKVGSPLVDVNFAHLEKHLPCSAVIIVFPDIENASMHLEEHTLTWKRFSVPHDEKHD